MSVKRDSDESRMRYQYLLSQWKLLQDKPQQGNIAHIQLKQQQEQPVYRHVYNSQRHADFHKLLDYQGVWPVLAGNVNYAE